MKPTPHMRRYHSLSRLRRLAVTLGAALCTLVGQPTAAQTAASFPSRPIYIVVPTPAGGPSDTAARQVAQGLSAAWGQQVIVENKPGASGAVAAQAVMNAKNDGYTLLWAQGAMAGLPLVQKSTPYRNLNELAPVTNAVQFGFAIFANKEQPFKTFAELVKYGKANPGKLNFATGTLGEFMFATHVLDAVGVRAERVPYKGGAQLMPDLIGGQVQINF